MRSHIRILEGSDGNLCSRLALSCSILSSLKQRRRRRQRERQKSDRLDKQNNNFVNAARFFVHFLAALLNCDMRLPNFTRPHYGVCEHNTKIVFFFF